MNERIREMAYKTCFESGFDGPEHFVFYHTDLQKFAELLIKDCIEAIQNESMNSDDDWERGLRIAEGAIQKHFGVEE